MALFLLPALQAGLGAIVSVAQRIRPANYLEHYLSLIILSAMTLTAQAQTPFNDTVTDTLLQQVMPGATRFSDPTGEPPVYIAYDANDGIIGYAFRTADWPPEEIGFSDSINVLVGMDTDATITAVHILNYRESFLSSRGDFMGGPVFQGQFRRKALTDDFRVGRDIDGVSRATITSWATTRGIFNSARRVAAVYLKDSNINAGADTAANVRAHLEPLSWQQMTTDGLVRELRHRYDDGTELVLPMTYMGDEVLGDILIGANAYSTAERAASARFDEGRLFLVAIAGDASDPFRQERLSIRQGDTEYPMPRRHTVYAGSAYEGKISRLGAHFAVAMVLDPAMDLSQPFTVFYDPQNGQQPASVDIQLQGVQLDLAMGREILAPGEANYNPVTQDVNWARVLTLIGLLALVMLAFLRKSARLRWVALSITLVYLGFITGGFLSVSHITNTINQGPAMILGDTALLVIVLFTLITTLIWGRVFCSSVCPFGAVQDLISRFTPKRWQRTVPAAVHDKAIYLKYAFLAFIIVMAVVQGSVSVFQYFEPFGTLFFYSTSVVLWSILALILLASVFVRRFYCRYVCPLGAALGVLSLVSLSRIRRVPQCSVCKVCEHACPTGAIRKEAVDFKECVRCDICESKLIQKAGVCKHSVASLEYRGVIVRG